jgi:hypothetical protein
VVCFDTGFNCGSALNAGDLNDNVFSIDGAFNSDVLSANMSGDVSWLPWCH